MWNRWIFLRVSLYFGEPVGRVKIQETSKNIPRYFTLNRPITDLLLNLLGKQKKRKLNFLICFLAWQTISRDYSASDRPGFARLMLGCCWLVKNGNLSNLSIEKIGVLSHFFTVYVRLMFEVTFVKNRSNRFSVVQIPWDICTRFECYLYSTECS